MDQSIFDDFVIESREHIDSIQENLMVLEGTMESPEYEIVNKLFRAVHTIKGGAGFLGLSQISKLSHSMENLMSNIREGINKVDVEHIDTLLDALDMLTIMIDNPSESNNTDISDITQRLDNLSSSESPARDAIKADSDEKVYLAEDGHTIPYNKSKIKSIPKDYTNFFIMRIDLVKLEKDFNVKPYRIISDISSITYIIEGELDTQDSTLETSEDNLSLYHKLFVATAKSREELYSLLPDRSLAHILSVELVDKNKHEQEEKTDDENEIPSDKIHEPQKKEASVSIKSPSTADQTIRLRLELIEKLMGLTSELVLARNRILLLSDKYSNDTDLISTIQQFDSITSSLQESVMMTRMQPVGTVFNKFPRIVRDLSKDLGKKIDLIIKGAESELDKALVDSLSDPMTHLIRNSCDHGIEIPEKRIAKGKGETGTITLDAFHESGQINIVIEDDGAGINVEKICSKAIERGLISESALKELSEQQKLNLIMLPGFSTAEQVSNVSGRGVGMDVVKNTVERLGGSFDLESKKDKGSKIILKMPLTLAIVPSFVIECKKKRFAIPQISIEEIVTVENDSMIEKSIDWEMFRLREELIPVIRLEEILLSPEPFDENKRLEIIEKYHENRENSGQRIIVILKTGRSKYGLIVDNVLGTEEIVVKPMHSLLKKYTIYSGATIMGDGKVALILNADGIGSHAEILFYTDKSDKEQDISKIDDHRSVFLFNINSHEQYAVYLKDIIRIEKFDYSKLDSVGSKEYVSIENKTYGIIRIPRLIDTYDQIVNKEMYLILLKDMAKPSGILATEIIDSVNISEDLDEEAFENPHLLGTLMIDDRMTLFLDSNSLKNIQ